MKMTLCGMELKWKHGRGVIAAAMAITTSFDHLRVM